MRSMAAKLTPENYAKGFLIDDELLAGVAPDSEEPGRYLAFVLQHTTGEQVGAHRYESLDQALDAVNRIERGWAFEKAGGCGGGKCGSEKCGDAGSCGGCKTGACPI